MYSKPAGVGTTNLTFPTAKQISIQGWQIGQEIYNTIVTLTSSLQVGGILRSEAIGFSNHLTLWARSKMAIEDVSKIQLI